MRGVSKVARRYAAALALLAIVAAPSAFAASNDSLGDRFQDRFARAKRFIVTALSRLGTPPG
jgi:hypothetical protein